MVLNSIGYTSTRSQGSTSEGPGWASAKSLHVNRRQFLILPLACALASQLRAQQASLRPPVDKRTFHSPAVERTIADFRRRCADPELAWLFENCYPNTLDTTITAREGDTWVITGDIPAMWLRDSTAQVWPYLPLAKEDAALTGLFRGLIRRQALCVLLDPYANAFLVDFQGKSEHTDDKTEMKPGVWERKWEVDSLAHVLRLSAGYWKATGDRTPFDKEWVAATALILETFREQQRKNGPGPYTFQRKDTSPTETLWRGTGFPTKPVGLIHSSFRPSDDATILPFLVPANAMAVVGLRDVAPLLPGPLSAQALALAAEVDAALRQYAVVNGVLAYEVDGLGNAYFMDDANVPSLLSLPYLGWCKANDPLYQATRARVLSPANPYFFGKGIGSPHTGPGRVWPIALMVQGLTSTSPAEVAQCVAALKASHAGTGFMHEAYDVNDPSKFSRPWFSWANSLFGEFLLTTIS